METLDELVQTLLQDEAKNRKKSLHLIVHGQNRYTLTLSQEGTWQSTDDGLVRLSLFKSAMENF